MYNSRRLALYHYWVAFAVFLPAAMLGAWQMLMRSPLPAPLDDPNAYYASVTLHGTAMAYVVTTFFAMGFGYAVAATSLGRLYSDQKRGAEARPMLAECRGWFTEGFDSPDYREAGEMLEMLGQPIAK